MDATWRNVPLADAAGALTPEGTRLLEQELADERLAVVTLLGAPSTRAARCELAATLLGHEPDALGGSDALLLLGSVRYEEEDFHVLLLDVNTPEGAPASGLELLTGALCALSALVISCYDEIGSPSCLLPALPAFQSLFQTLVRDYSTMEVYELLPKMLSVDLSPSRSLAEKLKSSEDSGVEALDSLIRFKRKGIFYPRSIAHMRFDEFCGAHATVKRLFGLETTGEMLGALLHLLSIQALGQDPMDFGTAWDDYVEEKCRVLAEDALNTYVDCVHPAVLEQPPMELTAFVQLHEEIYRLSMDVYHAASKYKSTHYRTVRHKLKADIHARHEAELSTLTQHSRAFCEELRQALWTELHTRAVHSHDGGAFAAMLAAIQDFDTQFNETAQGPEKSAVLREFYQHEAIEAFQQLENVVTQQLSESRLEELRLRLEKDFADKKEALVEHFRQEEAQLRAGMARDLETMQKMHETKAARAKLDGGESKRLREEVAELKRQNAELEEKTIVLEHAQLDAANQKAVLSTKVDELELAVRREMASRTELVDTLALTIKTAEEKEKTLNEKIAELQLELGEKTFRVEGELQDLAQQLRKTNEEKEELQKKLNEFFLKVTALPEALQQHLFCLENDGQIDFADALTSFMSR